VNEQTHSARFEKIPAAMHILGVGIAVSLLGDGTLMTVLPQARFSSELSLTLSMVAWALSINRLVRLGFNPLAGNVLRILPRRKVLISALILGAVSTWICSLGGLSWVLLGRILWGLAWAGLWVGGSSVVLDLSRNTTRGKLSGLFQMWFFLGVGTSSLIGSWLADHLGLVGSLQISAVVMVAGAAFWFWLLPETGEHDPDRPQEASPRWSRSTVHAILIPGVPMFVNRFLFAGVLAATGILWLETYVGDGVWFSGGFISLATLAGIFAALKTLLGLPSSTLTGRFSDSLNARWPVMATVLALGAAGCLLMSLRSFPLALTGFLLSSPTSAGVQTLLTALVGDKAPLDARERILGALFSIGDLGSTLGPLAGLTWVQLGSISTLYRAAGLLLVGSVGYALLIARRVQQEGIATTSG